MLIIVRCLVGVIGSNDDDVGVINITSFESHYTGGKVVVKTYSLRPARRYRCAGRRVMLIQNIIASNASTGQILLS